MWNARLDEAQVGIKIAGRNIITSDMPQMTPPYDRKQIRTKEPLDDEKSEKAHLKLHIQKMFAYKSMASSSITSWQIDGETMEAVSDFILGAPESLQMVTTAMKLKDACSLKENLSQT